MERDGFIQRFEFCFEIMWKCGKDYLQDVEGLDVVNVGLGAVLYNTETHTYFTPNTGIESDLTAKEDSMLENHIMEEEFKESGNSSDA